MESSSGSVIIIGGKTERKKITNSVTVTILGGVSGLFAALKLAEKGFKDVTVIEVQKIFIQFLPCVGDKYK